MDFDQILELPSFDLAMREGGELPILKKRSSPLGLFDNEESA